MKFKYRNREFWCRGYYVDTVGKNTKKIVEYIKKQLKEDEVNGQEQYLIWIRSRITARSRSEWQTLLMRLAHS